MDNLAPQVFRGFPHTPILAFRARPPRGPCQRCGSVQVAEVKALAHELADQPEPRLDLHQSARCSSCPP
jgi:hypothetical protein